MSLLAPIVNPVIPEAIRINGQVAAVKIAPRRMTELMVKQWEQAFDALWLERDGITPVQRLAGLGTIAAELFEENTAFVSYLISRLTGKDDALVAKIMAKVATIPAHTVHEDGTVTLD